MITLFLNIHAIAGLGDLKIAPNGEYSSSANIDGKEVHFNMIPIVGENKDTFNAFKSSCNTILMAVNKPEWTQMLYGLSLDEITTVREEALKNTTLEVFKKIPDGVAGFLPDSGYVCCATSKPFSSKSLPRDDSNTSFNEKKEAYKNILMAVSIKFLDGEKTFESRGIFRNPYSYIDTSTPTKLSIPLLTFSAICMKTKFPDVVHMYASPLPKMLKIFEHTVGKDKIQYNNDIPAGIRRKGAVPDIKDTSILIDVDSLIVKL